MRIYENREVGKIECWYIIDCEEDYEIVIKHNTKTTEEFMTISFLMKMEDMRITLERGYRFYCYSLIQKVKFKSLH